MSGIDSELKDFLQVIQRHQKNEKEEKALTQGFNDYLELARKSINDGSLETHGRGDEALVQYLRKQGGVTMVTEYQALPLVHFLRGEQIMDLWPEVHVPTHLEGKRKEEIGRYLMEQGMRNLVFDKVVFYIPNNVIKQEKLWAVCMRVDQLPENGKDLVRKHFQANDEDLSRFMVADLFLKTPEDWGRGVLIFDRENLDKTFRQTVNISDYALRFSESMVLACFAYLAQCPDRTVEIRKANPRNPIGSKRVKNKPWRRDDLPHLILLDPTRAVRYGCFPTATGDGESKRKSPMPHGRRGHYRYFNDGTHTFVRPAWIGPREWTNNNVVYKVVRDKKVSFDDASDGD